MWPFAATVLAAAPAILPAAGVTVIGLAALLTMVMRVLIGKAVAAGRVTAPAVLTYKMLSVEAAVVGAAAVRDAVGPATAMACHVRVATGEPVAPVSTQPHGWPVATARLIAMSPTLNAPAPTEVGRSAAPTLQE